MLLPSYSPSCSTPSLISTFPPDSDTAWATISTGMNPAQHGIVRFVDPLEKSYQILNVGSDNEVLRGKTFWEILGRVGLKAHAIFPHLGYPIWEMPGHPASWTSTPTETSSWECVASLTARSQG